jgi:hypothetical protein
VEHIIQEDQSKMNMLVMRVQIRIIKINGLNIKNSLAG